MEEEERECCFSCDSENGTNECDKKITHAWARGIFKCEMWNIEVKKPELPDKLEIEIAAPYHKADRIAINQITEYLKEKE